MKYKNKLIVVKGIAQSYRGIGLSIGYFWKTEKWGAYRLEKAEGICVSLEKICKEIDDDFDNGIYKED